ncbi:DHHW family protein [Gorillibacterium sp. CAU 1737]|uniref:DHHW family protein n=1 Tax=Gorillibacterium sp. CAU 1737 TaxID=3140362 RepID=UPI003261674F
MSKTTDRMTIVGFAAVIFLLSLLFLVRPKLSFSETENRVLQQTPQLTWENLWSKRFMEQTELYLSDHFPFREKWVQGKSALEQLRLQQENNGIFKGSDGYLFERFEKPDFSLLQQYTDAIKEFALRHPETRMTFMLAPTSIGLYPDRLPWLAPSFPQEAVNAYIGYQLGDSVTYLNGFDFLRKAARGRTPIYYRTDHHWTTYGAYLAYAAYAKQMGWPVQSPADFYIETVTDNFLGSYHTRSQLAGIQADSIQRYVSKQPADFSLYITDTDQTVTGLYDNHYLTTKDKYAYFLGGVHALLTIKNKIPTDEDAAPQKLLVIKDSYAHSVLPFLALHVPEIHVIDLRYYNGDIHDYMERNEIQDVLMLFNTATFVNNRELLRLKGPW